MLARRAGRHRRLALWMLCAAEAIASRADAITLQQPAHFRVARTFTVSPGVPRPLGALRFTPDGTGLWVVGAADTAASALYRLPVTRSATLEVTALGTPAKVFDGVSPDPTEPDAGLDAGLELGPGGTLFYSYFPTKFLGQRPGGVGGVQHAVALPALLAVSGLAFAPARTDGGTGFGYLHVSTGITSTVYEIPLVAGATPGVWVPNPSAATRLLVRVLRTGPPRVGGDGVVGLHYVPAGTFAGDLLYASFVHRELWTVRMADATGLPIGGSATPVEDLFASGFGAPPIGLEFDPLRPNELFVSTYDPSVDANDQILQIAGFASTAPTTTLPAPATTTSTSSSTTSTSTSTSSSSSTSRPTTTTTSTSTSRPTTSSTPPTTTRPTTSSTSSTSASTSSTSTSRPSSTTTSTSRPTTTSTSTTTTRPTTTTSTSSSTSTSTSTTRPSTSTTTTSTTRPSTSTTIVAGAIPIRTSSLSMRDRTGPPPAPVRRRFVFHAATSRDGPANAVAVPARGSAGDPTAFGGELVVRNAAGSGEAVAVPLPAAGWAAYGDGATPSGYRFTPVSSDHPVSRVVVRANRLRIRAGGGAWAYTLDELAQGALAVRLRLGAAMPWCALAPAKSGGSPPSTAAWDRVDRFVAARNTPPPASCPPF